MNGMEVVDYDIQTYQYIYSGPDDEEGTVQFDKATWQIEPGDAVQFWNYGFNLNDESMDDWFEASDFIEFTQEPVFWLEFLEFEDESGQLIEYQQAIWAEDVSGNAVLVWSFPGRTVGSPYPILLTHAPTTQHFISHCGRHRACLGEARLFAEWVDGYRRAWSLVSRRR